MRSYLFIKPGVLNSLLNTFRAAHKQQEEYDDLLSYSGFQD